MVLMGFGGSPSALLCLEIGLFVEGAINQRLGGISRIRTINLHFRKTTLIIGGLAEISVHRIHDG